MMGPASGADGSKKSPTLGNRLKQHHIYPSNKRPAFQAVPSPSDWDLGPPTKKPTWFTSSYLGALSFGVGRRGNKEGSDFITLCVCLEVVHTFQFLTNLRPNGMTPELMSFSPRAPSSKSSRTAPIVSLFCDNRHMWVLKKKKENPTSLTRSVYPPGYISLRVRQAL